MGKPKLPHLPVLIIRLKNSIFLFLAIAGAAKKLERPGATQKRDGSATL